MSDDDAVPGLSGTFLESVLHRMAPSNMRTSRLSSLSSEAMVGQLVTSSGDTHSMWPGKGGCLGRLGHGRKGTWSIRGRRRQPVSV